MEHATLLRARMLSPSVRELTFRAHEGFRFVPGQWVSLRIPLPHDEEISRSYSIASPPRAGHEFDLAVTRVDGGPGSEALHAAVPGDTFRMSHAQGFFTLDPLVRPVLLVGTGTGIAPLRSMLHAALVDGDTDVPFTVLFGVRTEQDVLYGDELAALADHPAQVRFEPTLSRASDAWTGRRGYVQTHLVEIVGAMGGAVDVYVCGLSPMIREVRRVLKEELGFTRDRIHSERFD